MRKFTYSLMLFTGIFFISCSSDDDGIDITTCADGVMNGDETGVDCGGSCAPCETAIENPTNYVFTRDGQNTVSFDGQTTRIKMGQELLSTFNVPTNSLQKLTGMFAHEEGADDFEDASLNASDKSLRSKVAASADYFSTNATDQALIRTKVDGFISAQVNEVYPNWEVAAAAGTAGQIADGERTRYVSGQGLEYNQLFAKSLIGSLMADQMLNNYLSPSVLDEGENIDNNDEGVVEEGKPYTTMEHKWDEAYGYAYGLNADPSNPNADLGADSFLNEYIERADSDDDFSGIADEIFQAFKLGRAAIVAKKYDVRDQQANIIRENISKVIAIRAIYYLQGGKSKLSLETPNYGGAFHSLSEAYGFIYSLQFTRKPNTGEPYFSKSETEAFLTSLLEDGENGLWDVTPDTLDTISEAIAARFDFTVAQAAE
ncbi:DUF4856 domain-containing protein [Maribacter cobaltidurans]|uniref:DUF4856 domain-containing protein n=1 Tax=Maribacter cobaltidurans TaxID=1178778 RepID=A0A223V1L4_9FLAO|nr:DUF4856 domain-containing protein [Maribacter cobaltidurans]ASV29107.1 DUF4856 domain-containing protein [Maribacter cobaltidurans]